MAHLLLQKEAKPLFRRPLDQTRLTIGRDPACDIQLLDAAISRQHCVIEKEGRSFVLKDFSRNGTFVNAKRIALTRLHEGDRIQVGPWQLIFSLNGNETTAETFVEANQSSPPAIIDRMLGNSKPTKKVLEQIRKAADCSVPVCLVGASGTGKELAARLVHDLSSRCGQPFVAINCGAIPANLIESLLFGHERGSFTGACERHQGVFEQADGGTLFLDEIGEMPLELQTRLLRVLETQVVRRVGGKADIAVDVRLVAATLRNLKERVIAGQFREDLFFRLFVFSIDLPSLAERKEDIVLLANHFLGTLSPNGQPPVLSPKALAKLKEYAWPGNVRELRNVIQRALLVGNGKVIEAKDVELTYLSLPNMATGEKKLIDQEKCSILEALRKARGNRSQAARLLGIARTTLASKLRRYQIKRQEWL